MACAILRAVSPPMAAHAQDSAREPRVGEDLEEAVLFNAFFHLRLVVQKDIRENGPCQPFCFIGVRD